MGPQTSTNLLVKQVAELAYQNGAQSVWHFGSSVSNPESAHDVDIAIVTEDSHRSHLIDKVATRWPNARIEGALAYTGGKSVIHKLHIVFSTERDLTHPIGRSITAGQYIYRRV